MQPQTFNAYSLEELLNDINLEEGSAFLDYVLYDICACELSARFDGMEYSLIYLNTIINAITARLDGYNEDPDVWELDLIEGLTLFMKDKDEQTLVYIQGC